MNRYSETLDFAGKMVAERVTPGKRKARSSINRTDAPRTLTETTNFSQPERYETPQFKHTETWERSADLRTLAVTVVSTSATDSNWNWSMKGVYHKAPEVREPAG